MDTHATERISDLHAAEAPAAGAQASGNDKRKLYIKKLGTSDITLTEQIAKAEKSNFSRPLTADALAQMLSSSPYGITALLSGDGQVLSYAVYLVSLDEAQILSVCSAVKSQGYAYRLLSALIPQLKASGICSIYLEVRQSNAAARALYEKLGFVTDGYRRNLYEDPTEDGCIMHI